MFLETKKEGETQTKKPSLAGFVAWLETKNPSEPYNYWNFAGHCLVGQYVNAIGLPWNKYGGEGFDFFHQGELSALLNRIACDHEFTFGAALERARMALSGA